MSKKRKSKIDQQKIKAIKEGALWLIARQFALGELHYLLEEISINKFRKY